ncbi:MAG: hypothetical protein NZV14_03080 [Bryobacteraceae bacterium]|nr:hypothetical protein [Bryobacteraceae bacterium]MDW8377118.1 hypothetical protein [Bryobacterales bacterium]
MRHPREEPDPRKTAWLEAIAAGIILLIIVLVLAMIFFYKPAG